MSVSLVAFIIYLNAFHRYTRLFVLRNVVLLSFGRGNIVLIPCLFVYLLGNNFGKLYLSSAVPLVLNFLNFREYSIIGLFGLFLFR
jgi:hypothetical protein